MWHGEGVASDEHPNLRRARFEALARDELIEPLRRYLARRTDPDTVDDVLADTLLVCWRRFDELPVEPLPWAYAVARNCFANAQRSARRQERLAAKVAAVDRPRESEETATGRDDVLHAALARLSEADAEVLRLWAWEQLTPAEIGEVLDISPNAASIRLHRARSRLRAEIGKVEDRAGHEESEGGRPG